MIDWSKPIQLVGYENCKVKLLHSLKGEGVVFKKILVFTFLDGDEMALSCSEEGEGYSGAFGSIKIVNIDPPTLTTFGQIGFGEAFKEPGEPFKLVKVWYAPENKYVAYFEGFKTVYDDYDSNSVVERIL